MFAFVILALQKVSLQKLNSSDLGVTTRIPKGKQTGMSTMFKLYLLEHRIALQILVIKQRVELTYSKRKISFQDGIQTEQKSPKNLEVVQYLGSHWVKLWISLQVAKGRLVEVDYLPFIPRLPLQKTFQDLRYDNDFFSFIPYKIGSFKSAQKMKSG